MSYTDLRDFHAEFETTEHGAKIEIEKLGGGTIGQTYVGTWRWRATFPGGRVIQGQDLVTGMPKTHQQAAEILADFL